MNKKGGKGGKPSMISGTSEQVERQSFEIFEHLGQTPFLLYGSDDDKVRVRVLLRDETIWLSLSQMAELFDVGVPAISKHLKNIYETDELSRNATVSKMETVQPEGDRQVRRRLDYYNLDAIIAVGYRVNSHRATRFRIWATGVLKEFITKGFALDDERLKQGRQAFGADYFRELLERVRSIRASERRIWQQITDVFAECSIDYDPGSEITQDFFATVQNKFHYAITGQSAAEIIHAKADRHAPHMGLLTWKHAPEGRVLASDVTVAKNYLAEQEMAQLARLVNAYLDVAEDMAQRKMPMTMQDWETRLNRFIEATDRGVLQDAGKVTAEIAKAHAESEFENYRIVQDRLFESDFDRVVKEAEKLEQAGQQLGGVERKKKK